MSSTEMNVWVPAVAALVGALVGALVPIVVTAVQTRAEHRRERMRLAVEIGLAQYRKEIDVVLVHKKGGAINPVSVHFLMTLDLLNRAASGKNVTAADLQEIREKSREWLSVLEPERRADRSEDSTIR